VPEAFVPPPLRAALYPYAYRYLIERSSARHGVDPLLLVALIREESKFDPRAASAASARGLTQFLLSTAQTIASEQGMSAISPRELEQPEVSIELGAAYLRGLLSRHQGRWPEAIAAYNAGEPQAQLWRSYCYSTDDDAEYFSKVAFRETRGYLGRVLGSYAQYRDLYATPATTSTGGR
jgi:soluble lytic murein transglycosylase